MVLVTVTAERDAAEVRAVVAAPALGLRVVPHRLFHLRPRKHLLEGLPQLGLLAPLVGNHEAVLAPTPALPLLLGPDAFDPLALGVPQAVVPPVRRAYLRVVRIEVFPSGGGAKPISHLPVLYGSKRERSMISDLGPDPTFPSLLYSLPKIKT